MNFKLLQKLLFFMVLGLSLSGLQSCGDVEETIEDVAKDYGKISGNSLVATGGYRDVKPLKATILASIKTAYQGAYTTLGVEFTPNTPDFNSSETKYAFSNSGISNGHFETVLSDDGEGLLKPGTTYYYRAYVYMAGTKYNGEVRSFVTPDLQVSKTNLVDLGVSVKWASNNMGANSPEIAGTALQQCYAFKNFNNDRWDEVVSLYYSINTGKPSYFPNDVDDYNWLGNRDYDVVTRTMGSGYRIPTADEWEELEEWCYWKNGVYNGVKGFYISDRVDGTNVIFLPYIKKSTKHDITVYLSAPDDIIRNLREVMDLERQYLIDCCQNLTTDEFLEIKSGFYQNRLYIETEFGQGEVLTETSHIFNEDGLILRPIESNIASYISDDDLSWTHPTTRKTYHFYKETDTYGGGVLYVRPVSNR
ncbi:MAG: hypothetical protein IKT87_03550 [Bacteroidaceae bacterium]|nr:hypothetical protein [Bacteroidaceae bacterium]